MNVRDIMTSEVTALSERDTLGQALDELEMGRIRHLPIVDRAGALVGLVSHRDLVAAGADRDREIRELMQTDVKTASPDTPAHEAAYLLLRHAIGCVPVTESDGKLVGIVTEADFVRIAYTNLGGIVPVDEIEAEENEAEKV